MNTDIHDRSERVNPDAACKPISVQIQSAQSQGLRAPRYTSYPTADRLIEAFGPEDFEQFLKARNRSFAVPLSVYVHIPFCESLCFYCACNKKITTKYAKAERYVSALLQEIELVDAKLAGDRKLLQMHWGGGTPTFLHEREIRQIMQALRDRFEFSSVGEYSIEIDPRSVDAKKMALLADIGFNRISLGVQDFDPAVQRAVNRIQPEAMVESVLNTARTLGFESTNFDLIYGLPRQTLSSFSQTLESVIAMQPERIALYNYAHLPSRFKSQRLIKSDDLPAADEKIAIFRMANDRLDAAGYEYIGMDHFALPGDGLALALKNGTLHRNFQGYSTLPDCDLLALGASGISRIGSSYSQNHRGIGEYMDRIAQGILPTHRGLELSRDDLTRRSLIMALMCQGEVDKVAFGVSHLIEFDNYFKNELATLGPWQAMGYVRLSDNLIEVTQTGRRMALRAIASVFDKYLQQREARTHFSQVL